MNGECPSGPSEAARIERGINTGQRIPDFGMMEESVRFCFGMCKMPVSVESQEWKKYGRLEFVEFLELIGRVAEYKFRLETELPLY